MNKQLEELWTRIYTNNIFDPEECNKLMSIMECSLSHSDRDLYSIIGIMYCINKKKMLSFLMGLSNYNTFVDNLNYRILNMNNNDIDCFDDIMLKQGRKARYAALSEWLNENCQGNWKINENTGEIEFACVSDAVVFKLKWAQ